MKSKQQKYQEAVDRNLTNATRTVSEHRRAYAHMADVASMRQRMGIRKSDHEHDAVLSWLLRN